MEHSADRNTLEFSCHSQLITDFRSANVFFIPIQRKQRLSQGLVVYFPIDLGAGVTRDPQNITELIKDGSSEVCLFFLLDGKSCNFGFCC